VTTSVVLDLNVWHFRQNHGDIEVFGTWYNDDGQYEPCLALLPAFRRRGLELWPCIVRLGTISIYSEEIGDPVAALHESVAISERLGLGNPARVVTILRGHLYDLMTIPPRPMEHLSVAAEITRTDRATGDVSHAEIMDDV